MPWTPSGVSGAVLGRLRGLGAPSRVRSRCWSGSGCRTVPITQYLSETNRARTFFVRCADTPPASPAARQRLPRLQLGRKRRQARGYISTAQRPTWPQNALYGSEIARHYLTGPPGRHRAAEAVLG